MAWVFRARSEVVVQEQIDVRWLDGVCWQNSVEAEEKKEIGLMPWYEARNIPVSRAISDGRGVGEWRGRDTTISRFQGPDIGMDVSSKELQPESDA